MHIDIITVLPELLKSPFEASILKRAIAKGLVTIKFHNLRDYASNAYKTIDDYQYGGGAGMVMMIEPIDKCISALKATRDYDDVIYMTPDGETLNQQTANTFSLKENLILLWRSLQRCGSTCTGSLYHQGDLRRGLCTLRRRTRCRHIL